MSAQQLDSQTEEHGTAQQGSMNSHDSGSNSSFTTSSDKLMLSLWS